LRYHVDGKLTRLCAAAVSILVLLLAGCGGGASTDHAAADSSRTAPLSVADIVDRQRVFYHEDLPGRWAEVRADVVPAAAAGEAGGSLVDDRIDEVREDLTDEQRQEIRRLESIGYVSGSQPATALRNVVYHDPARAYQGLNFYTSGHGPEAILTDMEGRVLHRWACTYQEAWPESTVDRSQHAVEHWRRAWLLPGGEVLAIFEGLGIVKLDRESRVIWANHCRAHHDLEVQPDGDILVLARTARVLRRVHPTIPVLEAFVVRLGPDGREKSRVSLLECFENGPPEVREGWDNRRTRTGDAFHTNSLEVLDGRLADRLPAFAAGRLLLSILTLDAVAVVDLELRQAVWVLQGDFEHQHDATVLENGNLMLLDNYDAPGRSAVQIFDPVTRGCVWTYAGSDRDPFYTRTCGTNQALPNGNLLVTESDNGRAFELAPDGTKVWEFYNPHRAGERGEFIATLFEVQRFEPDLPIHWVSGLW